MILIGFAFFVVENIRNTGCCVNKTILRRLGGYLCIVNSMNENSFLQWKVFFHFYESQYKWWQKESLKVPMYLILWLIDFSMHSKFHCSLSDTSFLLRVRGLTAVMREVCARVDITCKKTRHDRCQVWPCTLIHSTRNSEGTLSIRSQSKIDIDKENKSATVLYNGHPQLVLNHCEYCYQYSNTVSILRPEHLFIQYSYSLPVQHRA